MNELDLAQKLLETARRAGADEADVFIQTNNKFSVDVRDELVEKLTQSLSKGVGVRVFRGGRLGFACSTDFTEDALNRTVETAVRLASVSTADEANGLPFVQPIPDAEALRLFDPRMETEPTETKIEWAKRLETAMFDVHDWIVNSEGATCSTNVTRVTLANTAGAVAQFALSDCALVGVPIAAKEEQMQIAFDYSVGRFLSDLAAPEEIGRRAAEKALRKLDATKAPTQQCPIVLDRRIAARVIAGLAEAVDGDAVHRQMSFLKDYLDHPIASPLLTIVDDGTRPGALGSAPCDDEGVPMQRTPIVEAGVLRGFLYDARTARKTGASPTGNGQRSYNSIPHIAPSNFYVEPGEQTPEQIIASVKNGFFVTDVMGTGVNSVSGDVSFGASGLWIENGELTYAVDEVTIAGQFLDLLRRIEAVGNDLVFEGSVLSPTLLIGEMTVSGL